MLSQRSKIEGTYINTNRGGTLILVKRSLNPDEESTGDIEAEIIWITINPIPSISWLIGCCYRPEVAEEIMLEKICHSINNTVNTENVLTLGV